MLMIPSFSFDRFGRLFIKHTADHYKTYLMSWAVLIGVLVLGGILFIYALPDAMNVSFQIALYVMVMLAAGSIFTSNLFADYGDKKKAISTLTLPASHFEKYLVAWVYSAPLFLIVYTASFYGVLIFLLRLKPGGEHERIFSVISDNPAGFKIYIVYGLLQAVAFYGAIYFDKLHFIKTAFAFFITIAVLMIGNKYLLGWMTGHKVRPNVPFGEMRFTEQMHNIVIRTSPQYDWITQYLVIAFILLLWVAAYFRLKEKQV
jgi:hypothetical protein